MTALLHRFVANSSSHALKTSFATHFQPLIGPSVQTQINANKRSLHSGSVVDTSKAKYGGRFMVTLLPGNGIGPEMMANVKKVFKAGGFPVDFEKVNLDLHHSKTWRTCSKRSHPPNVTAPHLRAISRPGEH